MSFQQSTGQSFASQYSDLFVKVLQKVSPGSLNLGTNVVNIGGILLCMLLADRIGRRPVPKVKSGLDAMLLL